MTTIHKIKNKYSKVISKKFLDAILKQVLKVDDAFLLGNPEKKIGLFNHIKILFFIKLLYQDYPIEYIEHKASFFGRDFFVNQSVLIPREDSETIIKTVMQSKLEKNKAYNILDLGTGSGILAISLLKEYKNSTATLVDVSKQALQVAKKNAQNFGIAKNRTSFIKSDWFNNMGDTKFDIVVCNPPYVGDNERDLMSKNTEYEPLEALFSSNEGLAVYEKITKELSRFLKNKSLVVFETGFNKAEMVKNIIASNLDVSLNNIYIGLDSAKQKRVVFFHYFA